MKYISDLIILVSFILLNLKYFDFCISKAQSYSEWGSIKAIAIMRGSFNNTPIRGTVTFEQESADSNLKIKVNLTGLSTGFGTLKHGFHIHQKAITVLSDDETINCNSIGDHYNPFNQTHGGLNSITRHIGDYGNVLSYNDGTILENFESKFSTLFGPYSILGRSVVLHKDEDDEGAGNNEMSKSKGNSGMKIACGIVGRLN